jgi:hypothetical protein
LPTVGASLGGSVAGKLSRIIGHGDYETADLPIHNSLMGKTHVDSSFGDDMGKKFRIRRREFVKNVRANELDFSVDSVVCQPGLSEPFPFLSNVARNFSKYSVNGLVYEYVSNVSSYSSTPAMGSMIMTFDPNQGADAPTNKVAIENMAGAVSCRPDRNMVYGVECSPKLTPFKQYFIRTGSTPSVAAVAEDFGRFYIATSGLPSSVYTQGTILGELWVTYDITFDTPRMPTLEAGFFTRYGTNPNSGNIFGSTTGANSGGMLFDTYVTANRIVFWNMPPGSIVVVVGRWVDPDESDVIRLGVAAAEGCELVEIFKDGDGDAASALWAGTGTADLMCQIAVQITATVPSTAGYEAATLELEVTGGNISSTSDSCMLNIYTLGQGQSFAPY